MIITVTLNAAIDKTVFCRRLARGGITRAEEALTVAGGKGNNVARTVFKLGGDVLATGLAGGANGTIIRNLLTQEGIDHHYLEIAAHSRVCLTIIEEADQIITELYDPAPVVQAEEWDRVQKHLVTLAQNAEFITLNGSLPAGLGDEAYYELILLLKKANPRCRMILDSSGEALRKGIQARPFMIKPNRREMETLVGRALPDLDSRAKAVKMLNNQGIELVVLSVGAEGVVFGFQGSVYQIDPLAVTPKSTVGCGDALVGGFAHKFLESGDTLDAIKYGVAAATANLTTKTQGDVEREQVVEFFARLHFVELFSK